MATSSTGCPVAVYDLVRFAGQQWLVIGMAGKLLTLRRGGGPGAVRMSGVPAGEVAIIEATSRWPLGERRLQEVPSP